MLSLPRAHVPSLVGELRSCKPCSKKKKKKNKERKEKFVNTTILSQEKELWVLAAALIPGGLLPRFPDINSNSCPSLYVGILDGPEIIKVLSSS